MLGNGIHLAALIISFAGTPVISELFPAYILYRFGQSSKPLVLLAMKALSTRFFAIITLVMALRRATSVPGLSCKKNLPSRRYGSCWDRLRSPGLLILSPVNPAGQDCMVLSQVRSYDEYALRVGQIRYGIGHSRRSQRSVQTDDGRCMAETCAVVHVPRPQGAGPASGSDIFPRLCTSMTRKTNNQVPIFDGPAQAFGDELQSLIPRNPSPLVSVSLHWIEQPIRTVDDLQSSIALGTEGPFVGWMLWHILDPRSLTLLDCDIKPAACSTIRTDR